MGKVQTCAILIPLALSLSRCLYAGDAHWVVPPAFEQGQEQDYMAQHQADSLASAPLYTVNHAYQDPAYNTLVATAPANLMTYQPLYVDVHGNQVFWASQVQQSIVFEPSPPPPYQDYRQLVQQPIQALYVEANVEQESESSDCGCCVQ